MGWAEMIKSSLRLLFLVVAFACLSGCPLSPIPPFSANGSYTGQWSAYIPVLGEDPVTCNITLQLKQETLLSVYPLNHSITGKYTFDFGCDSVRALALVLGLPTQISYDIIIGTMASDGSVSLVGSDNAPGFTSGAIVSAQCVDANDDGFVDSLDGTWYFTVSTGSIPILVEGTFTAARNAA